MLYCMYIINYNDTLIQYDNITLHYQKIQFLCYYSQIQLIKCPLFLEEEINEMIKKRRVLLGNLETILEDIQQPHVAVEPTQEDIGKFHIQKHNSRMPN